MRPLLTTKTYNPMAAGRRPRPRAGAHRAPAALEPRAARRRPRRPLPRRTSSTPTSPADARRRDARAAARRGPRRAPSASATTTRRSCARRSPPGRVDAIQNSYSLLVRDDEAERDPGSARASGVAYTAFSPLAGGWLTGKYRRGEAFPDGLADDAAARGLRGVPRRRPRLRRRSSALEARARRARRLDGGARARLAARRPAISPRSSSGRCASSTSTRSARRSRRRSTTAAARRDRGGLRDERADPRRGAR